MVRRGDGELLELVCVLERQRRVRGLVAPGAQVVRVRQRRVCHALGFLAEVELREQFSERRDPVSACFFSAALASGNPCFASSPIASSIKVSAASPTTTRAGL